MLETEEENLLLSGTFHPGRWGPGPDRAPVMSSTGLLITAPAAVGKEEGGVRGTAVGQLGDLSSLSGEGQPLRSPSLLSILEMRA